ncbi:MAG: hypothetical protein AABW54_01045 [Candidatus Micrarchaeota archaeon]
MAKRKGGGKEGAPEKKDEPEETAPRLWLRKTVPFEHHVVPYRELHQDLKDEVDRIRESVYISRCGVVGTPALLAMFGTTGTAKTAAVAACIAASIGAAATTSKQLDNIARRIIRGNETFEEHRRMWLANYLMPYAYPRVKTLQLGKLVKKIAAREQAPFGKDSASLLARFHYGVVDNAGNLILLRHPSLTQAKGWRKLKQTLLWEQPFQRTRFELQKPPRKARQPLGEWLRRRLPARPAFALAPVRLR